MPIILAICGLIIVGAVVDGFRHGVIQRVAETTGLLVVFIFASRLADLIEPTLSEGLGASPQASFFGSWILVIVGGVILVRISSMALASLIRVSIVGTLDHFGGALVGLLFGSLVSSILLIGVLGFTRSDSLRRQVQDHPVTRPLLHLAPSVYDAASKAWNGEDFFPMIRGKLEPLGEKAVDSIKAYFGEGNAADTDPSHRRNPSSHRESSGGDGED